MRLLNTTTHRFKDFSFHKKMPKYAILSHRWGPSEVSYHDFLRCQHETDVGHEKIYALCRYAKASGHDWCWMDSCCIDKTSSTELSEAINSMFKWYREASLCVVYLEDVSDEPHVNLRHSAWFRRGWTLQELLAPLDIHFLSSDWQCFDTLSKISLLKSEKEERMSSLLAEITGIPLVTLSLDWLEARQSTSIAQIMSWASRRETLRKEDEAYCLLGVFGISMPLLYGEGEHAFRRLQKKLMKTRPTDDSIFYWMPHDESSVLESLVTQGMIARDPACFVDSGSVVKSQADLVHTWTNRGLECHGRCFRLSNKEGHTPAPLATSVEFFVLQTRESDNQSSRAGSYEIVLCKPVGTGKYQRMTHSNFRMWCKIELEDCCRREIDDKSITIELYEKFPAPWIC